MRIRVGGRLLVAGALVLTGACKKDEKESKGSGEEGQTATDKADSKTEPTGIEGEALVQRIDSCWGKFEAWDKDAFRDCFAESAEVTFVDGIPPVERSSRDDALVQAGSFRNAFPDFKAERAIILVNGEKAALVSRITGTHKNASLGMPPTGKAVSILYGQAATYDKEGRSLTVRDYMDQSTLLHQLGVQESATAASSEQPLGVGEPVRLVAKGDEKESANLEAVKKGLEALGKGDVDGAAAIYAEDATFRYIPDASPYQGVAEIADRHRSFKDISTDLEVKIRDIWAAGDWVVAEITTKGKLSRDLAGASGTKGKSYELNTLELYRLDGGKVKQHWSFANGLKFAADAGLFDPAMLGAPDEG